MEKKSIANEKPKHLCLHCVNIMYMKNFINILRKQITFICINIFFIKPYNILMCVYKKKYVQHIFKVLFLFVLILAWKQFVFSIHK